MARAAERKLRVTADPSAVMNWLTDPDRREREWRRDLEARRDVREANVVRLPGGGLRFESVLVRKDVVARHVIEDVAIQERSIDRILRGMAVRGRRRTRWIVKQRITVEWCSEGTDVAVHARGRPVGISLARHFLVGRDDTTTGRILTEEASRFADFVIAAVAGQFAGVGG